MSSKPPPRLSPKIAALVATDRLSRLPVGRLSSAQAAQLAAVVQRHEAFGIEVSPANAIRALAEGAKADVAIPVLQKILADDRLTLTERAAAARGLGRIATPEAERALLRHVRSPDPRVQQKVVAALGLFAGPSAGRTLSKVAAPADIPAYRQLVFAAALIAHRHGLDGPFLAETPFVERARGRPKTLASLSARTRPAKASKAARTRFRGPDYGIKFTDRSHSLECGPANWEMLLNEELGPSATAPTNLFKRPWIAGVLAQWLPGREGLQSRYVILTRPTGGTVRVEVVRADGEVVYTGTVTRMDKGISFRISDVVRPGTAPLNVVGRITSAGMQIVDAVVAAARVSVRRSLSVIS